MTFFNMRLREKIWMKNFQVGKNHWIWITCLKELFTETESDEQFLVQSATVPATGIGKKSMNSSFNDTINLL